MRRRYRLILDPRGSRGSARATEWPLRTKCARYEAVDVGHSVRLLWAHLGFRDLSRRPGRSSQNYGSVRAGESAAAAFDFKGRLEISDAAAQLGCKPISRFLTDAVNNLR